MDFIKTFVLKGVITILFLIQLSGCWSRFKDYIPNGNKVPNPCITDRRSYWSAVGHLTANDGGRRNPFGRVSNKFISIAIY